MSFATLDDEVDLSTKTTRKVGKARLIPEPFKTEPQAYLEATHHPYAPFTGDTLQWNSWVWDDATSLAMLSPVAETPQAHGNLHKLKAALLKRRFEGLTRHNIPHGKGVMVMGKGGKGGGFRDKEIGDKYEGEFVVGFGHGIGMLTQRDGRIFKGEFTTGMRDGCGAEYDISPWTDLVKEGMEPTKAWEEAKPEIMESVTVGTWNNDIYLEEPTDVGGSCSMADVKKMMLMVDSMVTKARMFEFKPAGDATFYKSVLNGAPIKPMQHPLHYPHGTLFMAPGPAGQTAAIPDDPDLKSLMQREYNNYGVIHDAYNFDVKPERKSLMGKATELWKREERDRMRQRLIEGNIANREMRRVTGVGKDSTNVNASGGDDATGADTPVAPPPPPPPPPPPTPLSDIDESDLVADATAAMQGSSGFTFSMGPSMPQAARVPLGTAFGSISAAWRRYPKPLRLQSFVVDTLSISPRQPRFGQQ